MTRHSLTMLILVLGLAASPAWAQVPKDPIAAEAPPLAAETAPDGEPWYGYLAFSFLAGITLFAVCKSSRRS